MCLVMLVSPIALVRQGDGVPVTIWLPDECGAIGKTAGEMAAGGDLKLTTKHRQTKIRRYKF
jgi:hypothetical protein